MEVSRRSFLGGALALSACVVLPLEAFADQPLPIIKGDGVHDDTAGLQAAFNGDSFICEGCVVQNRGGTIYLGTGTYRAAPLVFDADRRLVGHGVDMTLVVIGE